MQVRGLLFEEMNQLRRELSLMAARVEEDLGKALVVLRRGDRELAEEVKESEKIVDALQLKIEDIALALIATQQPVASDLRELITVFKITANLERIGDYGVHLVKAALRLSDHPSFRSIDRIERMVETAQKMLKESFSSYLAQDSNSARNAASLDDIIDKEYRALNDEVLALIKEQPNLVKAAARILRLSGYMERLGDHITNICEGIIYMIEGSHEELND
ncbi:MAG: phosphate signaling complex protein PhoU [Treponema sp.]|jgi:phosphate transport system protein|nr:phosphate signaling complex protein PhoU [Treponema sp.]